MFRPSVKQPAQEGEDDLCFAFREDMMLVQIEGDQVRVPTMGFFRATGIEPECIQHLGTLDGRGCYALGIASKTAVPEGMVFRNLRQLYGLVDEEYFLIGGRGSQIIHWDRNSRFCGRCGHITEKSDSEVARVCPACTLTIYPRISPAVIVAVTRDRRILLARAFRFPRKLYSVIAGFVEPGETLEQCIRREIREEVSIEVKNIRYFGSQPWPFPNSLMIAFTAEYAGGRLKIDDREIMDAGWFAVEELPPIPDKVSIARRLIDSFILEQTGAE
jgi:NAD+ diphosphatase